MSPSSRSIRRSLKSRYPSASIQVARQSGIRRPGTRRATLSSRRAPRPTSSCPAEREPPAPSTCAPPSTPSAPGPDSHAGRPPADQRLHLRRRAKRREALAARATRSGSVGPSPCTWRTSSISRSAHPQRHRLVRPCARPVAGFAQRPRDQSPVDRRWRGRSGRDRERCARPMPPRSLVSASLTPSARRSRACTPQARASGACPSALHTLGPQLPPTPEPGATAPNLPKPQSQDPRAQPREHPVRLTHRVREPDPGRDDRPRWFPVPP